MAGGRSSEFAPAQTGSSEVKAKDGEAKRVQGLHRMEDSLVVQRSAVERMGMTNQRCVRGAGSPCIQQSFQLSGRTFKKQGPDS